MLMSDVARGIAAMTPAERDAAAQNPARFQQMLAFAVACNEVPGARWAAFVCVLTFADAVGGAPLSDVQKRTVEVHMGTAVARLKTTRPLCATDRAIVAAAAAKWVPRMAAHGEDIGGIVMLLASDPDRPVDMTRPVEQVAQESAWRSPKLRDATPDDALVALVGMCALDDAVVEAVRKLSKYARCTVFMTAIFLLATVPIEHATFGRAVVALARMRVFNDSTIDHALLVRAKASLAKMLDRKLVGNAEQATTLVKAISAVIPAAGDDGAEEFLFKLARFVTPLLAGQIALEEAYVQFVSKSLALMPTGWRKATAAMYVLRGCDGGRAKGVEELRAWLQTEDKAKAKEFLTGAGGRLIEVCTAPEGEPQDGEFATMVLAVVVGALGAEVGPVLDRFAGILAAVRPSESRWVLLREVYHEACKIPRETSSMVHSSTMWMSRVISVARGQYPKLPDAAYAVEYALAVEAHCKAVEAVNPHMTGYHYPDVPGVIARSGGWKAHRPPSASIGPIVAAMQRLGNEFFAPLPAEKKEKKEKRKAPEDDPTAGAGGKRPVPVRNP